MIYAGVALAGPLCLLTVAGAWSPLTWWGSMESWSPFGQWVTAFWVAAWSFYGVYSAIGAWSLRSFANTDMRRIAPWLLVGCVLFTLVLFSVGAIRPGLA